MRTVLLCIGILLVLLPIVIIAGYITGYFLITEKQYCIMGIVYAIAIVFFFEKKEKSK